MIGDGTKVEEKKSLHIRGAGGQLFLADLDDPQQVAADGSALVLPVRDGEIRQLGKGVGQLRPSTRWGVRGRFRGRRPRQVKRLLRDHIALVLVQRLEQRDGRRLFLLLLLLLLLAKMRRRRVSIDFGRAM